MLQRRRQPTNCDSSSLRARLAVSQPNTIGALAVAVARDCGARVAYLPGLAMRKAAQLLPGDAKTDARDAFVIATCALKVPDTLRAVDRDSEVPASLMTRIMEIPRGRSSKIGSYELGHKLRRCLRSVPID